MRGETLMSQDPEQQPKVDDAPDPQFPYGATPQVTPPPPSYISPEFYAVQPPEPVQPPFVQSGYTVPTPSAYQPSQMQYGEESNYGHGGYSQGNRYGETGPATFAVPQATPLPLGEAIRQLPAQYWRVITRPSSTTFGVEMGKARWNIVWVQTVSYIIIITVLGFLSNIFVQSRTKALSTTDTTTLAPSTVAAVQRLLPLITFISTYGQILLIPLSLFIGTGLLFVLAKAFGGEGKFLTQLYSTLLFLVPLGLLVNVLTLLFSLLSGVGSLLSFLAILGYWGYEAMLLSLMLVPVHRLSGGRAVGAVLSLFGIALLLFCVLGFILAVLVTATATTIMGF